MILNIIMVIAVIATVACSIYFKFSPKGKRQLKYFRLRLYCRLHGHEYIEGMVSVGGFKKPGEACILCGSAYHYDE